VDVVGNGHLLKSWPSILAVDVGLLAEGLLVIQEGHLLSGSLEAPGLVGSRVQREEVNILRSAQEVDVVLDVVVQELQHRFADAMAVAQLALEDVDEAEDTEGSDAGILKRVPVIGDEGAGGQELSGGAVQEEERGVETARRETRVLVQDPLPRIGAVLIIQLGREGTDQGFERILEGPVRFREGGHGKVAEAELRRVAHDSDSLFESRFGNEWFSRVLSGWLAQNRITMTLCTAS
jgi:hypothetical protein